MDFTVAVAVKNDHPGPSYVFLYTCPTCFALVASGNEKAHEEWHENGSPAGATV